MGAMAMKFTASLGLALGLGCVFTPLGCASGPQGTRMGPSHRSSDGPSVPASTVARLTECAEQGAGRLTDTHYAIMFDVAVKEDGEIHEAKIRESLIGDREIESCMTQALLAMSLPGVVTPLRPSATVSRGTMSPDARVPMGNVLVLPVAVNLVPIVLVAAGVTIVVAVTVHAISGLATRDDATDEEAEKERCKKVLEKCIEKCTREAIPSGSPSGDPFFKCRRQCLQAENCWGVKLY
ncbi:hypothetical protein [Polyangium jinanense]|uniref:Uncharacterized protein n=1 Tax=Polyangium jinanense TaxID=2829994 RepID=A0A9X4AV08_9BACT|nr:hypothetical protein [Polyangium jinanense]MDC3962304.1 hypothetical protein [Polyangium jinanense]MDC3985819.1 hypothetical protein [Polyangium jinanense]